MPKDRLNELQKIAKIKDAEIGEEEVSVKTPLKSKKSSKSEPYDDLFKEIEVIRSNINSIEGKAAEVKKLQASIISSPNADELSRRTLDQKIEEIKSLSKVVNEQLKDLHRKVKEDEKVNKEQREKGVGDVHQADLRIKNLQHGALVEMFKKVMVDYSESQVQFQDQMKGRLIRTLKIANSHMTDEEIDQALEDKRDIQVFAQQYLESTERAKLDLREIEERHQDLLKLEKSIQEVRDLFFDISVLIQEQGEKIERIDVHILQAKDYVESAVKQTEKAVISRRRYNKKKMCLVICVLVAVVVVALAITLSVVFR